MSTPAVVFAVVFVLLAVMVSLGGAAWYTKRSLAEVWRYDIANPLANAFVEWRCSRARRYLLRHDLEYRHNAAAFELALRRDKFYDNGGRPSDLACPQLQDVLRDFDSGRYPTSA